MKPATKQQNDFVPGPLQLFPPDIRRMENLYHLQVSYCQILLSSALPHIFP